MKVKILRGLPGSGKSTYAQKLAKDGWAHFENDMYFMKNGKYVFDQAKAHEAATWCYRSFIQALLAGDKDVVVSNVFVTKKAVDRYVKTAKDMGAEVEVIRFNRSFGDIHNVPKNVYAHMKRDFQDYPGEKMFDYNT